MEWKYTNEILIKKTDPDPIDKIMELADKSGKGRAEVHFLFEIDNEAELEFVFYLLNQYGPMVTTFEILIPAEMIQVDNPVYFFMPENTDTRLIVTGAGAQPAEVFAGTLNLSADTLVVRNFRFDNQDFRPALILEAGRQLIAENLSFSGNFVEHHLAFMAKPLITLKSRAPEGQFSSYLLKNSSFIGNESDALLSIDDSSLGRFDCIELDHVIARDNVNMSMGIDISAVKEVFVHDCELTGSLAAPLLYQILPDPEVLIKDSRVSNRVYGYRPEKENWHTDARPVKKQNLDEAEGTTFDKVP